MQSKSNTRERKRIQLRILWLEIAVVCLLLGIGIASRFWLIEFPNFKPVAAIALFAGFFFRRAWVAIGVICMVMLISDVQIGFYQWQVNLAVYLSILFSVLLGWGILRYQSKGRGYLASREVTGWSFVRFVAASISMSTTFFVLTNLAVWAFASWYPPTGAGLVECFFSAVPFYRWTLCGDLLFTTSIVGSYALIVLFVKQSSFSHHESLAEAE